MTASTLQLDSLDEHNLQVMQAYAVRSTAAKAAAVEKFDGWLDRLDSVPGLSAEELTQLHGQLIALGFLKFEITGRSHGLRYQISPRGKQALDRAVAKSAEEDEGDNADEVLISESSCNELPEAA